MNTPFLPADVTDPESQPESQGERQALQTSGITQLTHLGVIRASGVEAAKFLQGQLTQDVASLNDERASLAAFCNAKGRMQASFIAFTHKTADGTDDVLLVCSRDILAQTLKRLSMFVMRAKVKLSDASDEFLLYGVSGSATAGLGAIQSGAARARIYWSKQVFDGQTCIQLYSGAGVDRMLWCAAVGTPPPAGQTSAPGVWHWLEVQSGVAMLTQPIFEAFVPQMLNYESIGGVNFKKGCYPGQEVVARSQFRGTLKRRAYVGQTAARSEPPVGQEVFHEGDAEQACGVVAASAAAPAGGFSVIVSMQTSAAAAGRLTLGTADGPELQLLPLPYPLLEDI
jgi:tRNA-modifying protein YgfZ